MLGMACVDLHRHSQLAPNIVMPLTYMYYVAWTHHWHFTGERLVSFTVQRPSVMTTDPSVSRTLGPLFTYYGPHCNWNYVHLWSCVSCLVNVHFHSEKLDSTSLAVVDSHSSLANLFFWSCLCTSVPSFAFTSPAHFTRSYHCLGYHGYIVGHGTEDHCHSAWLEVWQTKHEHTVTFAIIIATGLIPPQRVSQNATCLAKKHAHEVVLIVVVLLAFVSPGPLGSCRALLCG